MAKKVLIISPGPRKGGNSEMIYKNSDAIVTGWRLYLL